MKRIDEPWATVIAIGSGVAFALAVMVAIILFTGPTGSSPTTTAAAPTTTVTTIATTTTTAATTTTTTTPATTTTAVDFALDTIPKVNETIIGEPGPSLTDIRFGAHPGFTRIVFDFVGHGAPSYNVRYEEGPFFTDGEGAPVDVAGEAFIVVTIFPGATYDPEDGTLTYQGPRRIDPALEPIVEVVMTGDFEAQLTLVIGLDGQKGFRVIVLDDPLRVVVDIAT